MSPLVFQVSAVVIASFSLLVAVLTYRRAGKWRDSDEGKAFHQAQVELAGKVSGHETRLQLLEQEVENLPTKDDLQAVKDAVGEVREEVAEVRGDVKTVQQIGVRTESAVERIEGYMMRTPA